MGNYSKQNSVYPIRNLKEIRIKQYPDIKVFAEKVDYCTRTIERAESGKARVRISTISKIALVLGVNKEDIIDKQRSFKQNEEIDNLFITNEDSNTSYFKLGMKNYTNINNKEKKIKVRYMGRTGPIDLDGGDKLNTLFFTTDTNSPLDECKVDISMSMKESNFLQVVDKLYNKYKNKPLDLNGLDESLFPKTLINNLNRKIISLRLGEEVTIRVIEGDYMEIVDFYPKGRLTHQNEIYNILQHLLHESVYNKSISLKKSIIPMGFEMIDKIIRCSLTTTKEISQYVEDNMVDFLLLRELFVILTYILVEYMENEVCDKESQKQIDEIHKQIISKAYLLEKLDELYGFERLKRIHEMAVKEFSRKQ